MKTQLKRLFTLALCLLCFGIKTYGQGIKWTEGLRWEQVKAKAKAENKYIFVDCYATWCGPCKQMDKEVYPLVNIGDAMNDKFISVKVQMDSTNNDTEVIKQYYPIARTFEKAYSLTGFPTYLFFSPNGEIVDKAMGFQKPEKFIQLIKDTRIPEKQLYTQIKACRAGKMDMNLVAEFIRRLNDGGDKTTAMELARLYMKNYLEALPETKFSAKENLQFMWDFQEMSKSEDRIYKLLYEKPEIVNTVYNNPELADLWFKNILKSEYVFPVLITRLKTKKEPVWEDIMAWLVRKSDSKCAHEILIDAKHVWYCAVKDWDKACDYEMMRFQRKDLKKLPEDEMCVELNTISWTLFTYCFNKKQLEQGLIWINEAVALDESKHKPDAARMDTKANLLYKLGRNEEAIALQEKAVMLFESQMTTKNRESELRIALNKMRRGEPTWEIGVKENKKVK